MRLSWRHLARGPAGTDALSEPRLAGPVFELDEDQTWS